MTEQLRALLSLTEDSDLVPAPTLDSLELPLTPAPGD